MRQDGLQRRRGRARAQRGQRAACADLRGWRPAAVRGLKTLACRRAGCVRAIANAPLSCFSRSQAASWGKRAKFAAMAVARTHSARQSSLPAWACLFTGRAWPCRAGGPAVVAHCRRPRRPPPPLGMRPRARPSPPAPACGMPPPASTPTYAGSPSRCERGCEPQLAPAREPTAPAVHARATVAGRPPAAHDHPLVPQDTR